MNFLVIDDDGRTVLLRSIAALSASWRTARARANGYKAARNREAELSALAHAEELHRLVDRLAQLYRDTAPDDDDPDELERAIMVVTRPGDWLEHARNVDAAA